MKKISALKEITNQGTGKFVLLTILSMGIYPLMWAWKNTDLFNIELESNSNFKSSAFIYLAIATGLSFYFDLFSIFSDTYNYGYIVNNNNVYDVIGKLITFAITVFWIIWSFKMKKTLEFYAAKNFGIQLKLNGLWTFLFQYFYINYCMNSLEDDLVKGKMLSEARFHHIQKEMPNEPSNESSEGK